MTYLWTKVSGPGTVTFTDATNPATHVTFGSNGTYVLRLTATNVLGSTFDDVSVIVYPGCVDAANDPALPITEIAAPVLPDCS